MDFVSLLGTFVAIADTGSISKAARTVRLSVPMASRHLKALEDQLSVRLVRRTTRRLDLTEAGNALLSRARRILRDVEEAQHAVRPGKSVGGRVVVSAPVSFGLEAVAPLVPKLLEAHPRLAIDLRFDDRPVDLIGEGVDLALRTGLAPPDSPFVVARRLVQYERILCASPSFQKAHRLIRTTDALARVPCLLLGSASPQRWELTIDGAESSQSVLVEGRMQSNNVLALRHAALVGLGVAQLPAWLVCADLKARRLVRVLPQATLPVVTVWGLVHADARDSFALRAVQDFLGIELPRVLADVPRASTPRRRS